MTAHRCVFSGGPVAGKTVLVTGGGGAVGNYAIQLAKWGGARVLATVRTETQAEDARIAGADVILDRISAELPGRIKAETDGRGVDRIVEVDFGGNLPMLLDIIAVNGAVLAYASRGNPTPVLPFAALMRQNISIEGVLLPTSPLASRKQAQVDILQWLEDGQRLHRIAGAFPHEQTALAHKAVESGAKRGTVVVTPDR